MFSTPDPTSLCSASLTSSRSSRNLTPAGVWHRTQEHWCIGDSNQQERALQFVYHSNISDASGQSLMCDWGMAYRISCCILKFDVVYIILCGAVSLVLQVEKFPLWKFAVWNWDVQIKREVEMQRHCCVRFLDWKLSNPTPGHWKSVNYLRNITVHFVMKKPALWLETLFLAWHAVPQMAVASVKNPLVGADRELAISSASQNAGFYMPFISV